MRGARRLSQNSSRPTSFSAARSALTVDGIEEFKRYVGKIRAAFPDFHNHIEEIIGEDDKVVARFTYTGTHRGELFGFSGTGRKINYQGIAIFQFREGKIVSGFVLGDTESLKRQIAQA